MRWVVMSGQRSEVETRASRQIWFGWRLEGRCGINLDSSADPAFGDRDSSATTTHEQVQTNAQVMMEYEPRTSGIGGPRNIQTGQR